jgi:hypothetical protein
VADGSGGGGRDDHRPRQSQAGSPAMRSGSRTAPSRVRMASGHSGVAGPKRVTGTGAPAIVTFTVPNARARRRSSSAVSSCGRGTAMMASASAREK